MDDLSIQAQLIDMLEVAQLMPTLTLNQGQNMRKTSMFGWK